MTILVTVLHILVSLFLIVVVLLQQGKRADLAGAFGGGGSQTAFGTRGAATVLSKATTVCAVLFMATSITLSIMLSHPGGTGGGTVLGDVPAEQTQPAVPGSDLLVDPEPALPETQSTEEDVEPPAEDQQD